MRQRRTDQAGVERGYREIIQLCVYITFLTFGITASLAQVHPGALDTSFDTGTGVNKPIHVLALQADGKVVIAGEFTEVNGARRKYLARLNSDGSLDSGFDPQPGIVAPLSDYSSWIKALIVQPDGKILVGGFVTNYNGIGVSRVFRLNTDGSLDQSFEADPSVGSIVYVLHLLDNGSVLVGTYRWANASGPPSGLLRLDAAGKQQAALNPLIIQEVDAIFRAEDDSLLLGGSFTFELPTSFPNSFVRVQADGSVDTNFVSQLPRLSGVTAIAVLSDSKILVNTGSGYDAMYGGPSLMRLESDGRADSNFVARIAGAFPHRSGVRRIHVGLDNRILIAGNFGSVDHQARSSVARLLRDGSLDPSFHPGRGCEGGMDVFGPEVYASAVQLDGKIIVAGSFTSFDGTPRRGIARLHGGRLPDGPPLIFSSPENQAVRESDTITFSAYVASGGQPKLQWQLNGSDIPGATNETLVVAQVQPGDAGNYTLAASNAFGVAESAPATLTIIPGGVHPGAPDLSFRRPANGGPSAVNSLYELPEGKLLVAGWSSNYFIGPPQSTLARLLADGSTDETFQEVRAEGAFRAVVPQPDGRMIVIGQFQVPPDTNYFSVARLTSDGRLDETFKALKTDRFGSSSFFNGMYALALQADAKLVVGGVAHYDGGFWWIPPTAPDGRGILRLNANGEFDQSFFVTADDLAQGRGVATSNPESYAVVTTVVIDRSGRILVGGFFNLFNREPRGSLIRLNSDGTLDTNFNPMLSGLVSDVALQPDGQVLVAHGFLSAPGTPGSSLVRLRPNGSADSSLGVKLGITLGGISGAATRIALQNDGRILLAGSFDSVNGLPAKGVTRLNADGAVDTSFSAGFGPDVSPGVLTVLRSGKITVGGPFVTFDGLPCHGLVRLHGGDLPSGPPLITVAPIGQTAAAGTNILLVIHVASPSTPRYQWLRDDKPIAGATNAVLSLVNVLPRDTASYHVLVSNEFGDTASAEVLLNVLPANKAPASVDPEFFPGDGPDGTVRAVAIQPDGKIIIGGEFSSYDGVSRPQLARVNRDGSLDASFVPRASFAGPIEFLYLASDGRILASSVVRTVEGTKSELRWYNPDGSEDTSASSREFGRRNPRCSTGREMVCSIACGRRCGPAQRRRHTR